MRFDYYATTVREGVSDVVDTLAGNLGGTVEDGVPRHGYVRSDLIRSEGVTVATVLSGGRNGHPHVYASGDHTDALVAVVRGFWPRTHNVTRMDAAQDFDGPGAWDRLYAPTLALADERKLKISQAGDWHRLQAGRTLYIGSQKSSVFARLYEKGLQLRGLALDGAPHISPDLVRLELQVRPEGVARGTAALASPEEAFGYSDWSRELASRVMGLDVERVHIRERRQPDRERSLDWLALQYGEHLAAQAADLGSWAQLGLDLERRHLRWVARKMQQRGEFK